MPDSRSKSKGARSTKSPPRDPLRTGKGSLYAGPPYADEPVASPGWILGALLGSILLAAICVYVTICMLFWQGQWQMVFHPSHTIVATPSSVDMQYDRIRFDSTETGILRLAGWWIPAAPGSRYATDTVLFLRNGSGSLSNSVDELKSLHSLGINVFAFDYRGFGESAEIHPSERTVDDDADAAWRYLTDTRHLAPRTVVLYGVGLGAAVAANTAWRHPQAAGVVLEDLRPPAIQILKADRRTRFLPVALLFHDRFDPGQTLRRSKMPKLFLTSGAASAALYYQQAAGPKRAVNVREEPKAEGSRSALREFLQQYLPPA